MMWAILLGKSSAFLNNKINGKSLGILIPNYLSHDIDNIDVERAELYFNLLN